MIKKHLLCLGLAAMMTVSPALPAFAAVNSSLTSTTMENCGAYLLSGVLLIAEMEIILRFW